MLLPAPGSFGGTEPLVQWIRRSSATRQRLDRSRTTCSTTVTRGSRLRSGEDGGRAEQDAQLPEQARSDIDGPRLREPQHLGFSQVEQHGRVAGVLAEELLEVVDQRLRQGRG